MRSLKSWDDLQTLLSLSEQPDLDFKEARSRDDFAVEARKDIAALANTLGGHIIVGASTDKNRSRCTGFHGLPALEATALASEYENEAKACRPTPFISSHCIDHPEKSDRVVLVLSVGMSPVAPVGASLQRPSGGHLVDEGWCFPYRVGSHTKYLSPDQFGAYESMSARRAAALLNAIPQGERGRLVLRWEIARQVPGPSMRMRAALTRVRLERNTAEFELEPDAFSPNRPAVSVPLDDIATVWCQGDEWHAVVRGSIGKESMGSGPFHYFPAC